jgi:hypothetical protein
MEGSEFSRVMYQLLILSRDPDRPTVEQIADWLGVRQAMVEYLRSVIAAHDAYYDEHGYPMKGEWKPRRVARTGNEEAA